MNWSPRLAAMRVAAGVLVALLLLSGVMACARIAHDARTVARAEHEKQTAPPVPAPEAPKIHHEVQTWPLADLAAVDARSVELYRSDSVVAILPVNAFRALLHAADRVSRAANVEPPVVLPLFLLEEGWAPNAFAIGKSDRPVISVNFGMVALLGDDEGMWATVLGHELAHLKSQHQQKRFERSSWGNTASGVLTVMLGFLGVPLAPLLTDAASTVVNRGYSREDEREADALAVSYLRQAGYDPADALRFHEHLAAHSGSNAGGLLSTHPGGVERVEAMRRLIASPPAR